MAQEPAPVMWIMSPLFVHWPEVVKLTGRPEDAVAVTWKSGSPNAWSGGWAKVIVCCAWFTTKLASEMSKKTLPTASILILALLFGRFGNARLSEPSFGVDAASTVGNVCPPSEDSEIFTFAALIGAPEVPATSQVMFWLLPAGYVTAVSGEVTRNGPVPGARLTTVDAKSEPPAPGAPSRTVTRKFIGPVYPAVGSHSDQQSMIVCGMSYVVPCGHVPLLALVLFTRICARSGNVRL